MPHDKEQNNNDNKNKRFEPIIESVGYVGFLNAFIKAKCLKV